MGVDFDPDSFKGVVRYQYFAKERMVRFKETLCLMQAALGGGDSLQAALRSYKEELFPEVVESGVTFEEQAKSTLKQFDGKAFVISQFEDMGDYASLSVVKKTDLVEIKKAENELIKKKLEEFRERYKVKYGVYPDRI